MSKKIIYLLSLLMALSLVFASCKKNGSTAPNTGDGPGELPDVGPSDKVDQSTGLYTKYDDIVTDAAANEGYLQSTPGLVKYKESATAGKSGDFLRNPVITVLGKNTVLIVYEYRYESPGAQNDIGVDGSTVVDIKYLLSTDSGKSFATSVEPRDVGDTAGKDTTKAKGAPVVFKINDTTVAVVASGGAALSRVDKLYGKGDPSTQRELESSLWYTVGTLSGNSIQWANWKQIDADTTGLKAKISSVNTSANPHSSAAKFEQYATHSGKGVVVDNSKLLLPVVIADQGSYKQAGGVKEYMGFVILKGTWSSSDIVWKAENDTKDSIVWNQTSGTGTKYKEARLLTATSDANYNYLVVPRGGGKIATGKATSQTVEQPADFVNGGDGSAGFVQVPKWYGTATYDPANYEQGSGKPKNLLTHVANIEANLNIYVLNDTLTGIEGNGYAIKGYEKSKSSSIDVLGDGTIVMVAEGGFVKSNVERSYYVNFARLPQHYIANQTGNNQK